MKTDWIIIVVVLVILTSLVIYLIIRNQKDKEDVVKSFNEDEIDDEDDFSLKLDKAQAGSISKSRKSSLNYLISSLTIRNTLQLPIQV